MEIHDRNGAWKVEQNRPEFIVGTPQEAERVRQAGYIGVSISEFDAAQIADHALRLAREGTTAVVMLDSVAAGSFIQTCEQAGAAYRVPDTSLVVEAFKPGGDVPGLCEAEESEALRQAEEDRESAGKRLLASLGVHDVFDVALELAAGQADRVPIPTGISSLDTILGGGFPTGGLVTLGAVSSTGKTTLCLQVADHMAASGRPVLFVTVEQGRHELVAKSLSRLMREIPTRNGGHYVASSADIQNAEARAEWGEPMQGAFVTACTRYTNEIAPNLRIMEMNRQPTTADIRKAAQAIANQYGTAPVVFVDYLQLLSPASERLSERQAVDRNVMDLRHLARDMRTCVVAISSLNRSSYSEGVTLESFKESGGIEYGSDVLLGLQPRGMGSEVGSVRIEEQKRKARSVIDGFKGRVVREAEVKVLKNRAGAVPQEGAPLTYEAVCNRFEADTTAKSEQKPRVRL